MTVITPRERTAIIQSLAAGVVPAIGLHQIQVGRKEEVEAVVNDLKLIENGSSTVRFVVGRYGSGKTFFLYLMRNFALKRRFVVVQADITVDRRLHGSDGQARSLYGELMKNLATTSRPEGGALSNVVERWVGELDHSAREAGGTDEDVKLSLMNALKPLQELVSGFDFATVLTRYYEGYLTHNDDLQLHALRWLRAEYTTKTEARQDLGVRTIIDDAAFYDYLKLFAAFVRIAGYAGLLVNVDELGVLSHRLSSTTARNHNYETILRIVNDCLQGQTRWISFLFAGTDECLDDTRRGLFSYEAIARRLAGNRFARDGLRDFSGPVIRLESLTAQDCFVLLTNIRSVFASGDPVKYLLPDEGIVEYLQNCSKRMGAAYFQTPGDTVKDFVGLLRVLEQNPTADWRQLLTAEKAKPKPAATTVPSNDATDEDLSKFRI